MAVAEATSGDLAFAQRRERSPWSDAWYQLRQNKVAVGSLFFILLLVFVFIFADYIAPYHFAKTSFKDNNAPPSSKFLLGADYLGRDVLSRTLYGTRISLAVAVVAASISLLVGTIIGTISGFVGGRVDNLLMRLVDFLYGFPILIFVILLQVYFKALARRGGSSGIGAMMIALNSKMGGLFFLFIALGLLNWIGMARIARGQVLSYREKEFVEAARSIGAGTGRIMFRHLLPNIIGPLIVAETLAIPGYIFTEAFLSFIGLGVDPPTPSWGIMISESYTGLRPFPYQTIVPGVALSLTTLAFNFLGDGLRDAFDPRMRE